MSEQAVPLSAWCSMPPTITRHDAQHKVCEMRMEAGLVAECGCPKHANPLISKGSERFGAVDLGAQSGPESAVTDRGQRSLTYESE